MLATIALLTTAVPHSSASRDARAITPVEMRAYLAKVGRFSSPYIKWKGGAWRIVTLAPITADLEDEETTANILRGIRRAQRELNTVATGMRRIVAPRDLRTLHAALIQSVVSEARCTGRVADAVEAGSGVRAASTRCEDTFVATTARQRHWRVEVTAMARRVGVVVPFWVSKFGVSRGVTP